ncbi:hypothetical protein [Burkholderia ubonensis]|uniref:hypothetical protein n=1 Tax=Burkholderia ubonensis TaxID=101571 RepID=UPI000755E54A|nr:hypothetical protein [Burkholderia ubonensis]KVD50598.1 hypothetical protein WI86_15880 [Burkholderia ubonensis]KVD54738.1 hypothetical protein WI87_23855 [Burkholderia ubonensis]KWI10924.1 hypothetical protein WM01_19415 [Burkholderia ubonensis]KWK57286.1 hypothetical protein WM15_18105 [Burkholderia ubonensis]OJA94440.1 hypothetical protein BGV51_28175 [Burkholderia ubonensis]
MGNLKSNIFGGTPSDATARATPAPRPTTAYDMMYNAVLGSQAKGWASYLGEDLPKGETDSGYMSMAQIGALKTRYEAKYRADQEAAAAKARQDALDNDPAVKSAREAAAQAQANATAQAAAAKQAGIDAADASVNAANTAANGVAQRAALADQTSAQATDATASVDTNANSQGVGSNDPRRRYIGAAMSASNAAVSRGGAGISIS